MLVQVLDVVLVLELVASPFPRPQITASALQLTLLWFFQFELHLQLYTCS